MKLKHLLTLVVTAGTLGALKAQTLEEINFSTPTMNISTYVTDINNAGFVTGYYDSAGVSVGFTINPEGKIQRFLGTAGVSTKIVGINDHNVIAVAVTAGGNTLCFKSYYDDSPFSKEFGTPVPVNGITPPNVTPLGINNLNDFSGWHPNVTERWLWVRRDSVSPGYNGHRYGNGNPVTYYPTYAGGINDNGIVGGFYIDGTTYYPFLFDNNTSSYTLLSGGLNKTKIWGINNSNTIVGEYQAPGGYWTGFYGTISGSAITPVSLTSIFHTPSMQSIANGINDKGDIVGAYLHPNTNTWVGFIYRPQTPFYRLPGYNWQRHTWGMVNNTIAVNGHPPVWSTNYYGSFDYRITDPFANINNPPLFDPQVKQALPRIPNKNLNFLCSDWRSFAKEIDVTGSMNTNPNYQVWKRLKVTSWFTNDAYSETFGGVCYGFSFTSLAKYQDDTLFASYGIPISTNLSTINNSNSAAITAITRFFLKQNDNMKLYVYAPQNASRTPVWGGLYRLKNVYLDDSAKRRNPRAVAVEFRYVSAADPGGWHSILPYKIKTPAKLPFIYNGARTYDTLYVYDSNFPLDSNQYFVLNSTHFYIPNDSVKGSGYNTLKQLTFHEAGIHEVTQVTNAALKTTSSHTDSFIRVAIAPEIYYDAAGTGGNASYNGTVHTNTIPFLSAVVQKDVTKLKPKFYIMDTLNSIDVKSYGYADSAMMWNLSNTRKSMGISRSALPGETDFGQFNHRLMTYGTHDNVSKELSCYFMEANEDVSKGVNILVSGVTMNVNDSIHTLNPSPYTYQITRISPTADTYSVWVYTAALDSVREFKKEDIIINGNSTHTVVPYRGIDSTQTIILIDNGSNGTIDDSVLVVNVTSVRDYQSLQQEIRLYPNPAGQLLTLSYPPYMPAGARLHIADLTGRLLYNAPLDASKDHAQISLTQFIPGVYMLRITDVQGSTVFAEKFVKQ